MEEGDREIWKNWSRRVCQELLGREISWNSWEFGNIAPLVLSCLVRVVGDSKLRSSD